MNQFSVDLRKIADRYKLEVLACNDAIDNIKIVSCDVNRPGLPLAGCYDFFDPTRIQLIGKAETSYVETLSEEEKNERFDKLFSAGIPALIITRELEADPVIKFQAVKHNVPLLRTKESTSGFLSMLVSFLNLELGERITRHGVLVEVYGEGILILGESGVGKSEAAIELVKRGHRLVADDAVEIKKVSAITLVGQSPAIIRHFVELRGIGIVDVRRIFGMGAVKETEKIDMVISLEPWDNKKKYDRLGLEDEYMNILGIDIPSLVIPVKPGRNLAIIIEVAAMNNRQKRMGYNAAEELNKRLMDDMQNKL
ncbi:MAG: HPr(Ser) kinase/phosphatase [Clostridia bacterium]|nr:HPr(Ser) kinase/phosphatase [Clostridia bacterium]